LDSIIEIKNLSFKYEDGTEALKNVSLKIPDGKKVALLGANGAGKSTLFFHLNGIHQPQKGEIFYKGSEIKFNKKSLTQLRKKVGIVFQDPDKQLFSTSVYQEIAFGLLNIGLDDKKVRKRIKKAIEITGLEGSEEKPTHLLSYGQKKRVAIAAVLAMNPEVIVFDEPIAWLDPQGSELLLNFMEVLNQQGITLIIATHDVNFAYRWSDKINLLSEGEIIKEGSPKEIFVNNKNLKQVSLKKPFLLQIYRHLKENGLIETNYFPKNKSELFDMIEDSRGVI
jgi:cobalt/nickel transport system ATP-binding protein